MRVAATLAGMDPRTPILALHITAVFANRASKTVCRLTGFKQQHYRIDDGGQLLFGRAVQNLVVKPAVVQSLTDFVFGFCQFRRFRMSLLTEQKAKIKTSFEKLVIGLDVGLINIEADAGVNPVGRSCQCPCIQCEQKLLGQAQSDCLCAAK